MIDEERELWQNGRVSCVMISCCAGAELQLREKGSDGESTILLRELYPTKSDLYERARMLEREQTELEGSKGSIGSTGRASTGSF